LDRQAVDLVDGGIKSANDVGISRLVEAHVSIADLDEVEFTFLGLHLLAESPRTQDAAANGPDYAGSGPSHTPQETATINAVVSVVVND
jgi:hypothetical protein